MKQLLQEDLEEVLAILEHGGVIIYPTETSYGLGCDATNDDAVARIFRIKGRPEAKGLPILLPTLEGASRYVEVPDVAKRLAELYWPGPLNIVLKNTVDTPVSLRCAEGDTQSVRVSSHPFAQALVRAFARPLVATSANVSGEDALYSLDGVEKMFEHQSDKPDAVVHAGTLPVVPASSIVEVVDDEVRVLRKGQIDVPKESV